MVMYYKVLSYKVLSYTKFRHCHSAAKSMDWARRRSCNDGRVLESSNYT